MNRINEKTAIPISLVIVLAGGIGWFTMLYFQTQANAKTLEQLGIKQEASEGYMQEIRQRLARIEGKLDDWKRETE